MIVMSIYITTAWFVLADRVSDLSDFATLRLTQSTQLAGEQLHVDVSETLHDNTM